MIREKYSQKKGTRRVSRKRQSVIRVDTNIILILFTSDRQFYWYQFEWHFFIPDGIFLGQPVFFLLFFFNLVNKNFL